MTSFLKKKVRGIPIYDIYVIVDNYVEMGDFSIYVGFLDKNYSLFFSECLQEAKFKIRKILIWSTLRALKLTGCVFILKRVQKRENMIYFSRLSKQNIKSTLEIV